MIVNITNPQAITDWLQEMSAGDGDIAHWLQKAFTKALKKREKSAAPLREWPKNPPAWMKLGKNYHEFRPDPELKEKVSHIRDWLVAARRQDAAFVENLYPMNLASAFNSAEKYFTKVNQRNQSIIADDADTKTVMRFANGMRIVQLITLEALRYEGAQMGHCLDAGSYDKKFLSGQEVFYSLRDYRNRPHATMEVVVEGNILRQCKGKKNEPPVEKYMPMLQQFLLERKFRLKESAACCGLVQGDDGQYYSVNNLPENLSIAGNLSLYNCKWRIQLPKGLSVGGQLNYSFCKSLVQLPENLSVGGNLDLNGCIALKKLQENTSIRGDVYLHGCTALTQLPENLSIGGILSLAGCPNITSIPRSLKCSGTIYTDIGVFATVAKAADAFDRKYRPVQLRAPSTSASLAFGHQ